MERKIVGQRCKQISGRNSPWVGRWKLLIIERRWSIHSERGNNNEICCLSSGMQEDTTQLLLLRRSENGLGQVCLFLISTQPWKCVMETRCIHEKEMNQRMFVHGRWFSATFLLSCLYAHSKRARVNERAETESKNRICIEIQSFRRECRTHCAQFLFCCNMEFIGRM